MREQSTQAHPLTEQTHTDLPPANFLRSVGTLFAEFGVQDSGNVSYGVQVGEERFFVKTAGSPNDPRPLLGHPARVLLLRTAARLNKSVQHPLLPALHAVIESLDGPLLVFSWRDGELLGVPRELRDDPASSFQRFRALPAPVILGCLDAVFDLHVKLAALGWIAGDFYDGSLLYDFESGRLSVLDLDCYRDAPFKNDRGRMFGSSRFMAPEELTLDARIDEQTTVFVMGRTALLFLSDGTPDAEQSRGPKALFDVAVKACAPERQDRFASMAAFFDAWQQERTLA